MALSRVADGHGLQIRNVAANILNSSRGRPTRSGPRAWELGEGLITRRK